MTFFIGTPQYLDQQRQMHAGHVYGKSGKKWAAIVSDLALAHDAKTVLDYGAGTGAMAAKLRELSSKLTVFEYEPAVMGKDNPPQPADLVTCIDTLEHIEPQYLVSVLLHLAQLTKKCLFCVVATRQAGKTLPDGRNAHLIIEQAPWWQEMFYRFFDKDFVRSACWTNAEVEIGIIMVRR